MDSRSRNTLTPINTTCKLYKKTFANDGDVDRDRSTRIETQNTLLCKKREKTITIKIKNMIASAKTITTITSTTHESDYNCDHDYDYNCDNDYDYDYD